MTKFKVIFDHELISYEDEENIEIFEGDILEFIREDYDENGDSYQVFSINGKLGYQYHYSIEDKIEEI